MVEEPAWRGRRPGLPPEPATHRQPPPIPSVALVLPRQHLRRHPPDDEAELALSLSQPLGCTSLLPDPPSLASPPLDPQNPSPVLTLPLPLDLLVPPPGCTSLLPDPPSPTTPPLLLAQLPPLWLGLGQGKGKER
ncbi:hypothetical protein E2562_027042 [Oryza meyeriana var. granulata]|uniref:Uncharacterized protein n=1 Tax=Oryza meyeriana var. granulata TaxID=110450 RepID=A0A6G1C9K3_9ORYZ|nr:hypothetical protein E2562_027042 [Oryza meyeriana var. granulata]